jgi:hypothetical protein
MKKVLIADDQQKTEAEVKAAFNVVTISEEERAQNFAEASKLVKAYQEALSKANQLTEKDLILRFD